MPSFRGYSSSFVPGSAELWNYASSCAGLVISNVEWCMWLWLQGVRITFLAKAAHVFALGWSHGWSVSLNYTPRLPACQNAWDSSSGIYYLGCRGLFLIIAALGGTAAQWAALGVPWQTLLPPCPPTSPPATPAFTKVFDLHSSIAAEWVPVFYLLSRHLFTAPCLFYLKNTAGECWLPTCELRPSASSSLLFSTMPGLAVVLVCRPRHEVCNISLIPP